MKVTVLKNEKKENRNLIYSILMLIVGIVLIFDAEKVIGIIFDVIGALIFLYSFKELMLYLKQKNELNVIDNDLYIRALLGMFIGIIIIGLSTIITSTLKFITGMWLLLVGINKLIDTKNITQINPIIFKRELFLGLIYVILALYTFLASNVIFVLIGIFISFNAIYDLISYYRN